MRKRFAITAWIGLGALVASLVMPLSLRGADASKAVIDAGKKATALVEIYDGKTLKGWATAFCIDKSGVFVTNSHVAKTGAKDNKLKLVLDAGLRTQRSLTATVLKADADDDLAILRADHAGPYDSVELSDPTAIRRLTETTQVTVFGYPFGEGLAMREGARPEASITLSRIMALRHDHGELILIQLDGSINHGNSGGPVIDERGKVVGIVAAGIPGSAISFAIPGNRVGRLLVAAHVTVTSRSPADATAAFADVLADDDSQPRESAGRASVPDEAARKSAREVIRDLMAKDFADNTPKGKRALGAVLFSRGAEMSDDPAGCYELLSEACDVAVETADLDTAMKAAGEMNRRYDINGPAQEAALLNRVAPKVTSSWDSALLAAHGLLTADALVHHDMFPEARQLIPIIRTAAGASYSVQIQKQTKDRLAAIEAACAQYALAEPAINKLKTAPNDADANLTVGRFECFVRNDFAKGLPLLTRGSDAALRAAATADQAGASTGPACKTVGDGWWNQAAKETKDAVAANQCKARAGYWYRLGVTQLDGLTKVLVEHRLASLPAPAAGDAVADASPTPAPAPIVVRGPVSAPHNLQPAPDTGVTIVSADYGSGSRTVSVVDLIQGVIKADPYAPVAVGDWFGSDPAPNTRKSLMLTYRSGSSTGTLNISEGQIVPLPPIPKDGLPSAGASVSFKIIAARYGVDNRWLDVTSTIRKEVVDPAVPFKVRRMADEDLHFGWTKWLLVYFEVDGRRFVRIAPENETMTVLAK